MINIFVVTLLLSIMKLLVEDSLLLILMVMEMVSVLSFFSVLTMNPETLVYSSCLISILTIMISESVLSLSLFIGLLRASSSEKVVSLSLKH